MLEPYLIQQGLLMRTPRGRVTRLKESLEVIRALWTGQPVDYAGEFHTLAGAVQNPPPLGALPIVIGGAGERTLQLVAAHADWWNLPIYALDKLDELRSKAGSARVSVQEMVAFVPSEAERAAVTATAEKRFGKTGMGASMVIGTGPELVEHYSALVARGVERIYPWFLDFGNPATLAQYGAEVISAFA